MRKVLLSMGVLLLLVSCEEVADVPLSPEDTGLLVVEGVLTNERKNHMVRLTHPHSQPNGEPRPATGASVFILQDSVYALAELPPGSGKYYTPLGRAVFGKLYTLVIRYSGKEYFAQDSAVPVQPLQDLKYSPGADGYSLLLQESGTDPNYVEHMVRWDHTGACVPEALCEGRVFFYDLKTIDVNEIYKADREPFYFPAQSIVIRKKYGVSPGYRDFLRSMLSETAWRGGVFDVQRADVSTNLSAGATGFFAVCTVVSDTTIVE